MVSSLSKSHLRLVRSFTNWPSSSGLLLDIVVKIIMDTGVRKGEIE